MNRIILIGNGFDLAHNIKTSYGHFISDYWNKIIHDLRKLVNSIVTTYEYRFETEDIKIENVPGGPYAFGDWVEADNFDELVAILEKLGLNIIFKTRLLQTLTVKYKERNWVDIENEYYNLLKKSFKNTPWDYNIEQLNKDLNQIKGLLESYLRGVEAEFFTTFGADDQDLRLKRNIGDKIYSPFKFRDFTEASINRNAEIEFQKVQNTIKLLNEKVITISDVDENIKKIISKIGVKAPSLKDIRNLLMSNGAGDYFDLMPDEILFLNFNYTFTEKIYSNENEFESLDPRKNLKKQYIHIHGTTNKSDKNDVIFGFGDEIDDDYKAIENLNDNRYLENIKSIRYLETDNYKRLLEFCNNGDYQIFIFGHSCGISDRTLLNTLFEHKNCSSIKPFYHEKEPGIDNYSDIVRNISRNFNSKASMRDKVVNKHYCEPLS